jgi:hypothetical protein
MDQKKLLTFLGVFRTTFELSVELGEIDKYTDNTFLFILEKIKKMYSNLHLTSEEQTAIKNRIDSEYQIFQPDGTALLDDYDHQSKWFSLNKNDFELFYWDRYRNHLFKEGFSTSVLETLDLNTTDNLVDLLGNPIEKVSFSRKGLVVGDVQSGKTSNYIGLMTKAADAGYKVIILLTGTIESLRRQTQIRVEEGFIGYDVDNREWVGVGKNSIEGTPIPKSATSRSQDYVSKSGKNTLLKIDGSNLPIVLITKKNVTTLKNIRLDLTNLNLTPPAKQINTSMLIIDDEADNASVNTNDKAFDPTIINSEIRKLLNLFTKSNYVGFTATPFANVFIDPESENLMLKGDLFPKDFIYALQPPTNYFGTKKIFLNQNSKYINLIDDSNDVFPLIHKKEWDENYLFPSLIEAINSFLIVNTIRDINEGSSNTSHRSMLINVSRFIKVQEKIEELVSNEFLTIKQHVSLTKGMAPLSAIDNKYVKKLYDTYYKFHHQEYKDIIDWDLVFQHLYNAIKDIQIFKVPSKDKKKQLDYQKYKTTGLRVIVVGGLALSRGLTLEGLSTSYLYRNTSTFDVLMQMGRWFGYRDRPFSYENLCKVWMLASTKKHFIEISNSIEELKADLVEMYKSKKTPREFGIRVRNESDSLGITDRNKMRNSKKYIHSSSLYGELFETPFISSSLPDNLSNFDSFIDFSRSIHFEMDGTRYYKKGIQANLIMDLLKKLRVHELNQFTYFHKDHIADFILKNKYTEFDVGIINGKGEDFLISSNLKLKLIERNFDLIHNSVYRISGEHRKLGGPKDVSIGLSEKQLSTIDEMNKNNGKSFLVENRSPVVIFYPIKLRIKENNEHYSREEIDRLNKIAQSTHDKVKFVLGISIGFPKTSNPKFDSTHTYFINIKSDWWNVMKQMENEEDE